MSVQVGQSVWAFGLALLLSLTLMPISVILGNRFKLVVVPRLWRRGRSKRAVTYLGGPAVCVATLVGATLPSSLRSEYLVILAGGVGMLLLAYPDNKARRSQRSNVLVRRILQAVIAGAVWWFAFSESMPGPLNAAVVILWLVVVTNSLNMLDNMNGVAGSTVLATTAGLTYLAFLSGQTQSALPMAALGGACLGFLPHNFKRAKVYLGAGGPEFIGFLLGAGALQVSTEFAGVQRWIVAAALLAVPLIDGLITLLSRLISGIPLAEGNVDHISHKLARLGLRTSSIAVIHGFAALLATAAAEMAFRGVPSLPLGLLILYLALAAVLTVADHREVALHQGSWRGMRYAALMLLGLVALGLVSAAPAAAAALDLRAAKAAFSQGVASARAFDSAGARTSFNTGSELAASAEKKLEMPLTIPARFMPILGDNLRAASALASGARKVGPAAAEALKAVEIFPVGPGGPQIGLTDGRLDLQRWSQAAGSLGSAAAAVELALADVRKVDGLLLPIVSNARDTFVKQGEDGAKTLRSAGDAAALVVHFFGESKPRTWFLAIQNPVEQRATGGFLGAFGILSADAGKLTLEQFDADVDLPVLKGNVQASEEFAKNYDRFASRRVWSNANMTPDFPTAAEVIANMWEQGTKRKVDGVVALDAVGLKSLLGIVGPVDVAPVGRITPENFLPLALNDAYVRFPEPDRRVSFLLQVGQQVWERLVAGDFTSPTAVLDPFGEMVRTKRMQMWSREQQDLITSLGLGGELHPEDESDYLMVVGQNAGANKIDYYARRRISYQVDLSDPKDVRGKVDVSIKNEAPSTGLPTYVIGPFNPKDPAGLNRTFTSVYLPGYTAILGSTLDGRKVGVESKTEKGLLAASQFVDTLSGATSTMSMQTRSALPRPGLYRLIVQHQPSLNLDALQIDIVLPKDASVAEVTPGMKIDGNRVTWSGTLDSQKEFVVRYSP